MWSAVETVMIEAVNKGPFNWGKFLVARFDEQEWASRSAVTDKSLLRECGWGLEHVWVCDLQTGEGVIVRPGGSATADLDKHKVWVCVLFQDFLAWLYEQDLTDLAALPRLVELETAPAFQGYRRPGSDETESASGVA